MHEHSSDDGARMGLLHSPRLPSSVRGRVMMVWEVNLIQFSHWQGGFTHLS